MIPKVIHYCWFGGNQKPKSMIRCMESWKKYCPDYEIMEWNESNFDINCISFVREAYEAKKWAFVTDYARLKIIYENGGIYLDTDVELLKSLDDLLFFNAYVGMQSSDYINTGLGFGAEKGNPMIYELMKDYDDKHFSLENDLYKTLTCPRLNTKVFDKYGFKHSAEKQIINGVTVLPEDYLNPKDYQSFELKITENTYSIHHYDSTWKSGNRKIIHSIINILTRIFGKEKVMRIKDKIKKR